MLPTALHGGRALRTAAAIALAALALALSGCRPEPVPAPTTAPSQTEASTPSPTPTPTATDEPPALGPDDIALPASCDALYSPAMRRTLDADMPPLNDPGVTMSSSQIVDALELLNSGIPTIRCSWGVPSEVGLATNVSLIAQDQAQELIGGLQAVGFGCDAIAGGTLCLIDRTMIDLDDQEVKLGEAHFFRGNGWVSTAWIGHAPDGYVEDVAATLWS